MALESTPQTPDTGKPANSDQTLIAIVWKTVVTIGVTVLFMKLVGVI